MLHLPCLIVLWTIASSKIAVSLVLTTFARNL